MLIYRLQTICILVFINIIIIGSFSEITFAFERRQKEDQTDQLTMKTHFDAFWWATSLRLYSIFIYIREKYLFFCLVLQLVLDILIHIRH